MSSFQIFLGIAMIAFIVFAFHFLSGPADYDNGTSVERRNNNGIIAIIAAFVAACLFFASIFGC